MPIKNKKIDSSDLLDLNTYTKERKAIRSAVSYTHLTLPTSR